VLSALGLLAPALGWLSCCWLCRELAVQQRTSFDWRLTVALATGVWGAALTLIVETLSLGRALNRSSLGAAWLTADIALLISAAFLTHRRQALSSQLLRQLMFESRRALDQLPWFAKICWTAVAFIAAFLFAVAITTPPTNWDSLSYHLPRVMHWIQQQSVEHFPTDNTRQLEFGPWPAFVSAHLFLLGGSDRMVNLPQWFAMVITTLLLSWLVQGFGRYCGLEWCASNKAPFCQKRQNAAALAALMGASIPMGMMQAMTPQTDYITSLWIVSAYAFALACFLEPDQPLHLSGLALSLSLALLSKSTALLYAGPLGIWFGVWIIFRRVSVRWKLKCSLGIAVAVLSLNVPHAIRNFALFDSPLGSSQIRQMVRNERIAPGVFASNLIRNLALHNNCGIDMLTRSLNRAAASLHSLTGERIDDPRTTYPPGPVRFHDRFLLYDDYASAPLHVLAIVLAIAWAICRKPLNGRLLAYVGSVLVSLCLFVALLKYQAWHSRFHLVYFVLFSPVVAMAWIEWLPRRGSAILPACIFLYAAFCLRQNEARPIFNPRFAQLPREKQYLDIHGSAWNPALAQIADEIVASGCTNVGLKLGFDGFEYPIWMMLRNRGFKGRIDHYYVEHVSARLAADVPPPCVIITRISEPPPSVTNAFPHRTIEGPLMALWAEKPPELRPRREYVGR
jgi:hypothetical protein